MPVMSAQTDLEALSLTFVTEHAAPIERVWQLWADPRQLERWWGPPEWPASVTAHDFTVGGRVSYHMTGPSGETSAAWMRITEIDAPWHLRFDEGFSHDDGTENPSMPAGECDVRFEALDDNRTRMTVVFSYASVDDLELVTRMGMIEGFSSAAGQIDAVLAG
jgi:uncharacterized protein YndB with AHSA1/START domain